MDAGIHERPCRATIAVKVALLARASFVAFSPCGASAAVPTSPVEDDGVGASIRHLAGKPDERIGPLFINPGSLHDTGLTRPEEREKL